jgi:nocardicin N-oxygenase
MALKDQPSPLPRIPFGCPAHDILGLHSSYDGLRHHKPVTKADLNGREVWLVTGFSEIQRIYRDDQVFLRGPANAIDPYPNLGEGEQKLVLLLDGARHRKVRDMVSREFTPSAVATRRPQIEHLIATQLDAMLDAGEPADLADAFTMPVALNTIGQYLGVPEADAPQFQAWGDGLLSVGDNREADNANALTGLGTYMAQMLSERRTDPAGDLLSGIATSIDDSDPNSFPDAVMLAAGLVIAGWETTASTFLALIYKLLTTTQDEVSLYGLLCSDPTRIPDAIEETLRLVPNSIYDGGQPRYVAKDTELGGQPLREGDIVVPAHDAADRDEREFGPHPERFNLARSRSRHLGFGWGAHHCLGADLARLELRLMLEAFTARLPALRLAVPVDHVTLAHGTTIRRLQNLKVAWSATN